MRPLALVFCALASAVCACGGNGVPTVTNSLDTRDTPPSASNPAWACNGTFMCEPFPPYLLTATAITVMAADAGYCAIDGVALPVKIDDSGNAVLCAGGVCVTCTLTTASTGSSPTKGSGSGGITYNLDAGCVTINGQQVCY
jgi:hypothetical protein